jgi:hypothetical protein
MALAKNTRTGKVTNVPEHYLGHPVFGADLEELNKVSSAAPKKAKKPFLMMVEEQEEQTAPEIDIETNEE